MGRKDVAEAFEQGEQIALSDLAQAHTDDAIQTLVRVMRSQKAPANAKVSAATRILEFAHGKASQSVNHTGNEGGLTINILRLSDGRNTEKIMDAVDVAKEMIEDGALYDK